MMATGFVAPPEEKYIVEYGIIGWGTISATGQYSQTITYQDHGSIPKIIVSNPGSYGYFCGIAWAPTDGRTRTSSLVYMRADTIGNGKGNWTSPYILIWTK